MPTISLHQKVITAARRTGGLLCVGLDTGPDQLPEGLSGMEGWWAYNKALIDATADLAVAYKVNTAFYEAHGSAGWVLLERTAAYLPPNTLRIADAKRGDIGNTAAQYARAFFEEMPFDALTVNPYMGLDTLAPYLDFEPKQPGDPSWHAAPWIFVLGVTSNPGAADFEQLPLVDGSSVAEAVITKTAAWATQSPTKAGRVHFVAGATRPDDLDRIRHLAPDSCLLVPGIGAQGGDLEAVLVAGLIPRSGGVLINVSRGIARASTGTDFAQKAHRAAEEYVTAMSAHVYRWLESI